jgi:hypothetical protein
MVNVLSPITLIVCEKLSWERKGKGSILYARSWVDACSNFSRFPLVLVGKKIAVSEHIIRAFVRALTYE